MPIFYNPPPPPTANSAGTPPEPHVPIGTQGMLPPRYTTALMLTAVLASWPLDLEPRLAKPNAQRTTIAPLISTIAQPPNVAAAARMAQLFAAWPPDLEPRLSPQPVKIAPLTLTYGDLPAPRPALSVPVLAQTLATWQETWGAQSAAPNAGWNVPPTLIVLPRVPLPTLLWTAWEPPYIAPPVPVRIAPLTLVYGQAPSPQPPLSIIELAQIVATWPTTWDAQTAPKNAAWNVPPLLTLLPRVVLPANIWTAWEPPFVAPPRPIAIVTLTLPTGNQPPVQPPLRQTAAGIILLSWPADLEPRLGKPNAEQTHVAPLTLVYGNAPSPHGPLAPVQLSLIARAWIPPFQSPPPLGILSYSGISLGPGATADILVLIPADDVRVLMPSDDLIVLMPVDDEDVIL